MRPLISALAAEVADPEDTIYRFRKTIGHLFEEEL